MNEDSKFLSRKFILTLIVIVLAGALPYVYKAAAVSDTITIAVLVLLAAVGTAYGFVNLKDAKIDLEKQAKEIVGGVVGESQAPK